jgi:hypothetical protein
MSTANDPLIADPELGVLRELEAELMQALAPVCAPAVPSQPSKPTARRLRLQSGRVTRRALVLVALVSLVGSSALATSVVFTGSRKVKANPTTLSSGVDDGQRWQLETYSYSGAGCYALFAAGTVASRCGFDPGTRGVSAASALAGSSRLVAGIVGADVMQVRVRVKGHVTTLPTHPPPASTDLPAGSRWFLAKLPNEGNAVDAAPAQITPLGRDDRRVGASALDCSLGGTSTICRRAAERLAARSGRLPR